MSTRILLKPKIKKKRNWRKIIAGTVILAILAGFLSVTAYRGYQAHRRNRLIENATALLDKHDLRGAIINTGRALQLNHEDLDAALIMARIREEAGQPDDAIAWRRKVMEHRPDDIANAVSLGHDQLQIGQLGAAQRLLEGMKFQGANNADYHYITGKAEQSQGKTQLAEEHLLKAVELDPKNNDYQYTLCETQLLLGTPAKRTEARERLLRLSQVKEFKLKALRLLINDMLLTHDEQKAVALADTVVSDLEATFADRLMRLELSNRLKLPEFSTSLRTLQDESLESTDHILALITWLEDHGMALVAVEWTKTMQRKIAADPRLKLALAESHIKLQDWEAAKELLASADWGEYKFLALAMQARLFRQEGRVTQAQTVWDSAIVEANKSQEFLIELERIAERWQWDTEAETTLWKLLERPYPPDWVFTALESRYMARLDSDSLNKLWHRRQEIDPSDMMNSNNLALVSLLRGEKMDTAHKMAADVYVSDKTNPFFVSTYAYSLHRQGKSQEALKVLSALSPEQLRDPSTAVCYLAVLLANGEKDKARELLPQIKPDSLLPEEKRLLYQSQNALDPSKT